MIDQLASGIPVLTATVLGLTAAANLAIAIAGITGARFVVANSAEVGVPETWLPVLAALKGSGAVGLLLGIAGMRCIGLAAASGLVLFFVGAIVAHVRARVLHSIAFPGLFLALAVASLALIARG